MSPLSKPLERDEDQATHEQHLAKMRAYYARTANDYDAWHCDPSDESSHNYAVHEMVKLLDQLEAKSVLDVACGTGRAIKQVLDLGYDAHGIDLMPELIDLAVSKRDVPRERLTVGDATTLPYEDEQFDVACIMGALHHTAQPQRIIDEMLRVSRLGIIVSDEGNRLSGGLKSILVALGIFRPIYRLVFRREPRTSRRRTDSEGDGPTFVFAVDEVIPQIRQKFSDMRVLSFYRFGRFQTCAFWYPRTFAVNAVVIARKPH